MAEEYGDWTDWLLCLGIAVLLGARWPMRNPDGHSPRYWKRHPERALPPRTPERKVDMQSQSVIRRDNGEGQPTVVELMVAVFIAIIPWTFPTMGIKTRCVLWLFAWALFIHLIFKLIPYLAHLPLFVKVAAALAVTCCASIAAYKPVVDVWREEKAEAMTGRFRPSREWPSPQDVKFQIGPNAAARFTWTGMKDDMQVGDAGNYIKLRRNDSGYLVADTIVRDHNGNIIVEIVDNEWRVSSAAWEKNYTDDSLEIKDARGRIIFQMRLLPDHAEFQAEWWDEYGSGLRLVETDEHAPENPPPPGKRFFGIIRLNRDKHPDDPAIQPMFMYPSKKYFGQLRQH